MENPMDLRPTVVIADRSEAFLMYLSILLNRLEFEALPMASGASAVKMVRAVRPNLMIIGAELAEADPLKLLALLREDESLVGLPIFFASANEIDEAPAMAAGATGFLAKPIGLESLHAALEQTRDFPGGKRRSPRIPFPHKVNLVWNGQAITCQAVSLSEGGIYIRRRCPFPQGCLLDIQLPMDDGSALQLEGEVLYTRDLSEDRFTLPPGMAIRFLVPPAETIGRLHRLISEQLVGDLIAEQDEPVICR
jgi:CheY-like chemotaxis protein